MRHRVAGNRLSRPTNARKALYNSLLVNLFTYGRIETTEARAKAVQGSIDKLINKLKSGGVNARREASRVFNEELAGELFSGAKERFPGRTSGYSRIIHASERFSDTARMVYLELIQEKPAVKASAETVSAPAKEEKSDEPVKKTKTAGKTPVKKTAKKS